MVLPKSLFTKESSASYRLTCGVSARRQDPDSRIQIALNFRAGGSHQGELKSPSSRRFKRNHHKTSSGQTIQLLANQNATNRISATSDQTKIIMLQFNPAVSQHTCNRQNVFQTLKTFAHITKRSRLGLKSCEPIRFENRTCSNLSDWRVEAGFRESYLIEQIK